MRIEVVLPRCRGPLVPGCAKVWTPWVEVALLVRVHVRDWDHDDEAWVHWAVVVVDGRAVPARARAFDPGRRAGTPGEPPEALRRCPCVLEARSAGELCAELLEAWRPRLHRHPGLAIVSRLDEDEAAFRRRLLAGLGPLLRAGGAPVAGDLGSLARLAAGIETRPLDAGTMEVTVARLGVGWYPEGAEPETPTSELATLGGARTTR